MTVEKFIVRNRWTGKPQFTAEISCAPDLSPRLKLGLAVKWARKNGADLSGAVLSDAVLSGAVLRGAVLRSFKADLWMTLSQHRNEVPGLVAALREGRVNGSTYTGRCACLVGTLANTAGQEVGEYAPDRNTNNPAEQWFLMISTGDKPGDDSGGGFAAGKALEWTLEYCALTGIDLAEQSA